MLLCILVSVAEAQVKVHVLIEDAKEPISHVSVITRTTTGSDFQFTNDRGIATIDTTNLSSNLVTFSHLDFKDRVVKFENLKANNFRIYLKPAYAFLPEFPIKGPKSKANDDIIVSASSLDKKYVKMQVPQTSADLLEGSGSVFIQKSQMGGGSPMIRGFSANRVLLVVDGVRINNAIFRDGNVHNVLSIDPQMIESVKVYEGPGSILYGSDAMGGVMAFQTKELSTIESKKPKFEGNTALQFHSANKGNSWHIDFKGQSKKWASITGVTLANYNSLRMGSNGDNPFLRKYYVEHIDGRDTMVPNENELVQEFSGYTQVNFSQKFLYEVDSNFKINASLFFATTSPIPRYDRLSQFGDNDTLEYAEWYYGPQKWLMSNLVLDWSKATKLYDELSLSASIQKVQESRITRDFQDSFRTTRTEDLLLYSINLDADKDLGDKTRLFYGLSWIDNQLASSAEAVNIFDFATNNVSTTRYPDGSTWSAFGAYITGRYELSKKWLARAGFRFNSIKYFAPFREALSSTFASINKNFSGTNGSLGFEYKPDKRTALRFGIASGFRAPNIDDIGKIFDSQPGIVTVPNENLDAEHVYTADALYSRKPNARSKFGASVFYSIWDGPIQRSNFTLDGEDSVFYEGEKFAVQALVNGSQAQLYGAGVFGEYRFSNAFLMRGNFNWQNGETSDNQSIRHIAPSYGALYFVYIANSIKINLYTRFNGELSHDRLAPSEVDKVHLYALDNNGQAFSPAWYTLNCKAIYTISSKVNMSLGVENILDRHYRPYSSGISAPGLNAIFSLRSRF